MTNIVIDHHTFTRLAATLTGAPPAPRDPAPFPFPTRNHRCSTLNGRPVEATEAVAAALTGHIRRVVIGADSVIIDLSRTRRLFTGSAALAVKLSSTQCYWPGCHVPVTDCQTDHLTPWTPRGRDRGGGPTNPDNGGPACGRHNRRKHHGDTVTRDPTRHWHTTRPDGTKIT